METTSSGIIPDFERCLAHFLERAEKEEIEKGEAKRLFAIDAIGTCRAGNRDDERDSVDDGVASRPVRRQFRDG